MARRPVRHLLPVAVVLLGACSGRDDPGTAEDPGQADRAAPSAAGEVLGPLPFDELLGTAGGVDALLDAYAEHLAGYPAAMTACMRDRGWSEYEEVPEPMPTREELEQGEASHAETAGVRQRGYGVADNLRLQIANATTDRSLAAAQGVPDWMRSISSSEHAALTVDAAECQRAAYGSFPHPRGIAVAGGGPAADAYLELSQVRLALEQAPEVEAVWSGWSRCMAGRGWQARRRTDLAEQLSARADPVALALQGAQESASGHLLAEDDPAVREARRALRAVEQEEDQMAADDVACAEPADLDRRVHAALRKVQAAYLDEHGEEFRRLVAAAGLDR